LKKEITPEEALLCGIKTHHEQMENGEKRFRLVSDDGAGSCRTQTPEKAVWQNSHYHRHAKELYVVQEGWLIFAEMLTDAAHFRKYEAGDFFVTRRLVAHNLYAGENTVLHTVKFGETVQDDWFPSPELDRVTKEINAYDMKKLLRKFR